MKYAIIGSGNIGTALARMFARKNIPVALANSRGPQTLAELRQKLGPNIVPESLGNAIDAEIVFLAVPFSAHKAVAAQRSDWSGKIVVDATNALRVAPSELNGRLSSEVIADSFAGARIVKAFNHLPAAKLGTNSSPDPQAVFISGNDTSAKTAVADIATQLGLAPIDLGRIDDGGVPLHVIDGRPGGLIFQDLVKTGDL